MYFKIGFNNIRNKCLSIVFTFKKYENNINYLHPKPKTKFLIGEGVVGLKIKTVKIKTLLFYELIIYKVATGR